MSETPCPSKGGHSPAWTPTTCRPSPGRGLPLHGSPSNIRNSSEDVLQRVNARLWTDRAPPGTPSTGSGFGLQVRAPYYKAKKWLEPSPVVMDFHLEQTPLSMFEWPCIRKNPKFLEFRLIAETKAYARKMTVFFLWPAYSGTISPL